VAHFAPTRPPMGRLSRLGVVINAADEGRDRIAQLSDRAGLGAVWLTQRVATVDGWSTDIWAEAEALAPLIRHASLGVTLTLRPADVARAAERAWGLAQRMAGRFELSLLDPAPEVAAELRRLLDSSRDERAPRLSALIEHRAQASGLLAHVDDVALAAWAFADLETAADDTRAQAVEAGRDASTLGVAAVLPVSIGRTEGEASARADRDELFERIGHPREIGIFGTLEECQDRVIALAHAGVTDLRAILPYSLDVHDVIAQLTAMTVGTTDVLVPGSLRSPAPPPPPGWGGRPDTPPTPRISGGSRRH
jgi:alkanesulfonate monooxygenase SsuD/methylene tetrahydromethanopterin reductase-like flavin-dependent oxidoreductase (luciferase family)